MEVKESQFRLFKEALDMLDKFRSDPAARQHILATGTYNSKPVMMHISSLISHSNLFFQYYRSVESSPTAFVDFLNLCLTSRGEVNRLRQYKDYIQKRSETELQSLEEKYPNYKPEPDLIDKFADELLEKSKKKKNGKESENLSSPTEKTTETEKKEEQKPPQTAEEPFRHPIRTMEPVRPIEPLTVLPPITPIEPAITTPPSQPILPASSDRNQIIDMEKGPDGKWHMKTDLNTTQIPTSSFPLVNTPGANRNLPISPYNMANSQSTKLSGQQLSELSSTARGIVPYGTSNAQRNLSVVPGPQRNSASLALTIVDNITTLIKIPITVGKNAALFSNPWIWIVIVGAIVLALVIITFYWFDQTFSPYNPVKIPFDPKSLIVVAPSQGITPPANYTGDICPIPNGQIVCSDYWDTSASCRHCLAGSYPATSMFNCALYPGTFYAIDIAGNDFQDVLLPTVGGKMVQWTYLSQESKSPDESIQKYIGTDTQGSQYFLQLHHTQPGSGDTGTHSSGQVGAKICGGTCDEHHVHVQIASGAPTSSGINWMPASQWLCK